jgi:hypothetical protein
MTLCGLPRASSSCILRVRRADHQASQSRTGLARRVGACVLARAGSAPRNGLHVPREPAHAWRANGMGGWLGRGCARTYGVKEKWGRSVLRARAIMREAEEETVCLCSRTSRCWPWRAGVAPPLMPRAPRGPRYAFPPQSPLSAERREAN